MHAHNFTLESPDEIRALRDELAAVKLRLAALESKHGIQTRGPIAQPKPDPELKALRSRWRSEGGPF